jgi:hypothetical protein
MDNALAESIIGLFKTEVAKLLGRWKSMGQLEWEMLKWPYGNASIAYRLTDRLVQHQAPAQRHPLPGNRCLQR